MEPLDTIVPGLNVNRDSEVALHRQIYNHFREGVLRGEFIAGMHLPSTRELAAHLRVGRNTVIAAYEQLQAEGFLNSHIGAGTQIADLGAQALEGAAQRRRKPARAEVGLLSQRGQVLAANTRSPGDVQDSAFVAGLPALDEFPSAKWSRILARHQREASPARLGYADAGGHPDLKTALANYLQQSRGVVCKASQVIVLSGAQGGLDLCSRMLLDAGDPVWFEEPGYPGARGALQSAGANIIPVPVLADGFDVQVARGLAAKARLAYVTPSHQFPLGVTLSLERRLQLIDWAARNRAWIIEDDYDSEYRYSGRPLSAMQGLDGSGRVVYLGTFSKTMFPALRVGYLVVPDGLQEAFTTAIRQTGHSAPLTLQTALAEFMVDGHFAAHLRRMRALYARRQTLLVELAARHLHEHLHLDVPAGGMQLPAWLKGNRDDRLISTLARREGLTFSPMSAYYLGEQKRSGLHLGYAAVAEARMESAVRTLAMVLAHPSAC